MAAPVTTDQWDEYVTRLTAGDVALVDSWNIGLYYDATDTIVASDDVAAVTTEPSGSGYATKTITPSTAVSIVADGADWKHDVDDQVFSSLTFSVATQVDAWYMSLSVQLDGDGSPTEHLMAVGLLTGGPYDLQNYTEFTAQNIGIKQTQG